VIEIGKNASRYPLAASIYRALADIGR
jgi:hypothetical protein